MYLILAQLHRLSGTPELDRDRGRRHNALQNVRSEKQHFVLGELGWVFEMDVDDLAFLEREFRVACLDGEIPCGDLPGECFAVSQDDDVCHGSVSHNEPYTMCQL